MNLQDLGDGQSIDMTWYTKFGEGKFATKKPTKINITRKGTRLWLKFGFNKKITEEIKAAFEGYKWHGYEERPVKQWSVLHCPHNWFQMNFLANLNPYKIYDEQLQLVDVEPRLVDGKMLSPYDHQREMTSHILHRHYCELSCEMGTGKSLAAIMAMELSGKTRWLWVAPRSALNSVELEIRKWNARIRPTMVTYHGLKKLVEEWEAGADVFDGVIFDESSRLKNPVAQRTQAAQYIADAIRREHGPEGYVVLMSGSPAPKSPVDWYSQCLPEDTWVMTSKGPQQIKDFQNQPQYVYNDSVKKWSNTGSFKKGIRDVFRIETKEGYEVEATEDHRFLVNFDGCQVWQKVNELTMDDELILSEHIGLEWLGNGTFEEGYLLGHIIGDGSISKDDQCISGYVTRIGIWPNDYDLLSIILKMLPIGTNQSADQENGKIDIYCRYLDSLRENYGLLGEKKINPLIEASSSDFLKGIIAGFFDTDGTVEHNRARVQIGQSDLPRLKVIQRILSYFGILSKIYFGGEGGEDNFQGRIIQTKDKYTLTVSGIHLKRFIERIPVQSTWKKLALVESYKINTQMSQKFVGTVSKITKIGPKPVYDISVPETQRFSANGFIAHNCKIACPGFLREGHVNKFKDTLAVIHKRESATGGIYPQLITWLDDERKCKTCGEFQDHEFHEITNIIEGDEDCVYHPFIGSKNEVARLYKRMDGLVLVKFKNQCLDLPEKKYVRVRCEPSKAVMRAARMIAATAGSSVKVLTLLRQLSDGFQYNQTESGSEKCNVCHGTRTVNSPVYIGPEKTWDMLWNLKAIPSYIDMNDTDAKPEDIIIDPVEHPQFYRWESVSCRACYGTGEITSYTRTTDNVESPKDQALKDILDLHDDVGRIVIFGGFTGSVDRCVDIVKSAEEPWEYIRVDGRGWHSSIGGNALGQLEAFQKMQSTYPRIAFIGQPGAAGMGLTLTAAPSIVYFSNDFNAESRIQSEDRIHRPGMDRIRGATIYDLIHLPTDEYVLENLIRKRKLQDMTLGEIMKGLDE